MKNFQNRNFNQNHSQKQQKPTFNVNPPFMGVTMVQLNHAMSIELQRFIGSINDVEDEILAFKAGLRDPANDGVYVYGQGPSFLVIRSFKGVVMAELNQEMRDLLIQFISDIEGGVDKIIWAFRLALENPEGRDTARSRQLAPNINKRQRIRGAYSGNPDGEPNGDDEFDEDGEYEDEDGEFEEGDEDEGEEGEGDEKNVAKDEASA